MDDFIGIIVAFCFICVIFLFGFGIGSGSQKEFLLDKYCAAQSGIYEVIDDVNYCVVDNQLFKIEWSE